MYKTIQSKLENEEGQRMFHPRAVYTGNVGIEQLAKEVAAYSSLTSGDVKNTIDNLITVMTAHMQASETVTLNGLGTFRLAFRSKGNGASTAEDVKAFQSRLVVRFTPSTTRKTDGTVATRSLITGVKCVPQDGNAPAGGQGGGLLG